MNLARMTGSAWVAAAVALALATSHAPPIRAAGVDSLQPHVATLGMQLDPRVGETLLQLDGTGRQLLALRSYLRGGTHLAERWSWNQKQIDAFEGSAEQRELQREIEGVRAEFVAANPGFDLHVNQQVRSLDQQIASWNSNASVKAAADEIVRAAQSMLGSRGFFASRPKQRGDMLKAFLSGYTPEPTPTVAAPGLSLHGQMRAIDFQVQQGRRIVAGPTTATIARDWQAAGWAAKLEAAVRRAGSSFVGPLQSPSEPWHYTYAP